MQPVRTHALKCAAWLLALVLVSLAATASLHAPHERALALQAGPEISASHLGEGAALTGGIDTGPFIRSAARAQNGLRGKAPPDPVVKAHAEFDVPAPAFAPHHARQREAKTPFPSSFVALRALGPRAPPARHA